MTEEMHSSQNESAIEDILDVCYDTERGSSYADMA